MKPALILLSLTIALSANAESNAFTAQEKLCFESLSANKLTYFIQKRNHANIYSMGSQVLYAQTYFNLDIPEDKLRSVQATHWVGTRIVDGKTLRVCMKLIGDPTYSCVKEVEVPLTDDVKKSIFRAVSDYIYFAPKFEFEKFIYPEYDKLQEVRKACENIDERVTKALDHLDKNHPNLAPAPEPGQNIQ